MQWFRMYAEFASDPKVQMMPEVYQRRWAMLLCMRCAIGEKLSDEEIMFQLRISETDWSVTKADFIERGFIDCNNKILNWKKRQYKSDCSTQRVYRHREKRLHEQLQKQECNVTCNAPEQNRTDTEQSRTEKPKPIVAALPDWVPSEQWNGYVQMRSRIKKPLTGRAVSLAVEKLAALMQQGYPPGAVLDQSTLNSWQGLFPLKEQSNGRDRPINRGRARFEAQRMELEKAEAMDQERTLSLGGHDERNNSSRGPKQIRGHARGDSATSTQGGFSQVGNAIEILSKTSRIT